MNQINYIKKPTIYGFDRPHCNNYASCYATPISTPSKQSEIPKNSVSDKERSCLVIPFPKDIVEKL